MLLGFKTELKVNNKQRVLLAKHAEVARHAWNWGLSLTKKILDNNQVTTSNQAIADEAGTRSKTVLSNIV